MEGAWAHLRRPHVATVMNGPWMSSPSDPSGEKPMGVGLLAWSNPFGLMAGLMGMFEQVTPGWLIGILILVYYIYI